MDGEARLELVGEVLGLLELADFYPGLMDALGRVVPADWISLTDLGPVPEETVILVRPDADAADKALFARHAHENPLVVFHGRTHDGRAYRFSDVCTPAELHATTLYREFYGPIGLEHQIAFTLPHGPQRLLAVVLSRRAQDFSDVERDGLNAVRPFLIQCFRNALEHERLRAEVVRLSARPALPLAAPALASALASRGVTRRQAEVLAVAATGRGDREIATALGLSERTVQKHLQLCFARLGVHTREEAVAWGWAALSDPRGSTLPQA